MTRHDRIHPIVTVADLPATVAFYEALGWETVTTPAWAAARIASPQVAEKLLSCRKPARPINR